ncbi:hypothetical protein [Bradyrhizobium sp. NBAIM02]|uniref:hypothetical protein n=1 Tax=Bradyrhizobium sp. NBAIM02 TaxID=2793817 RepID=UPI001CD65FD3|nr:hypothetical protein [Bradyrhizobium sp. NBAIM02]MCA1503806.1 hypothetical protein [Bradyrhizobium sp. NBAIM02]
MARVGRVEVSAPSQSPPLANIAVVDEIEAASQMAEDAQRLIDDGRQSSEARVR